MKTIFIILSALLLLASCSLDESNQPAKGKSEVYLNHDPVPDHLIGKYISRPGQSNYLPGTIEITSKIIAIDVAGHSYNLEVATYSTVFVKDCYYLITFEDNRSIHIGDWLRYNNTITLTIDSKYLIYLDKVVATDSVTPM